MHGAAAVFERIARSGVVAVVRLDAHAPLLEVASALAEGGIDVLEYTATTPGALEAVEAAAGRLGTDVLVGVGTVLDADGARRAIDAGAAFIVSPTLELAVIAACRERGVAAIPGAMTPSEILTAWRAGATIVKVFPAAVLGPAFIRHLRQPLPEIPLLPTGGISAADAADYIRAGAVAVGVGGKLVDRAAIASRRFDALTRAARELVRAVKEGRAGGSEEAPVR